MVQRGHHGSATQRQRFERFSRRSSDSGLATRWSANHRNALITVWSELGPGVSRHRSVEPHGPCTPTAAAVQAVPGVSKGGRRLMYRTDVARIAEQSKTKAAYLDDKPLGYLILSA